MSAEPTARFAARVAAAIFAGEALILLAIAFLYRSDLGSARVAVPALCGAVGLLLLHVRRPAAAADQALYAAKALGRNRCVIFNAEIAAIFAPQAGRGADEVQLATLLLLAEALDRRDTGTADHSRTVGRYCAMIAQELGLPAEHVKRGRGGGDPPRHRKIGLPDAILQKPGPLVKTELAEAAPASSSTHV